jgi:hypothetical protein
MVILNYRQIKHMGGFQFMGTQKWMLHISSHPIEMDDLDDNYG